MWLDSDVSPHCSYRQINSHAYNTEAALKSIKFTFIITCAPRAVALCFCAAVKVAVLVI